MITINLLPEEMRRKRPTYWLRKAAVSFLVLIALGLGAAIVYYHYFILPGLEKRQTELAAAMHSETPQEDGRIAAALDLVKSRVVWSHILYDLKKAVNAASARVDGVVWLSRLRCRDLSVAFDGYDLAGGEEAAMRLPAALVGAFPHGSSLNAVKVENSLWTTLPDMYVQDGETGEEACFFSIAGTVGAF